MVGTGLLQPLSLTRFRRNQYLPRVYGPTSVPLFTSSSAGEFGVSESLSQQIDRLQEIYKSESDPRGRAFVPLADAHRRLGDLDKALAVIQEGLGAHPDFASAHVVLGWVYRSRQEPDDAMRSFERVLELDAENTIARAAIAEVIDDQRAQAYRDEVAARKSGEPTAEDERPVVPIASLAPAEQDVAIAAPDAAPDVAPESVPDEGRPVVPIASLAPAEQDVAIAAPDAAPESAPDEGRPVVPIASLAPAEQDVTSAAPDAAPDVTPESVPDEGRPVVPIASLAPAEQDVTSAAPDAVPESVPDGDPVVAIASLAPVDQDDTSAAPGARRGDGEIYTQTLAELYATQGATGEAIEVYEKLIADDPDNEALRRRLTELESLKSGADGAPAQLDVRAGLGGIGAGPHERLTVSIESLAPDGYAGE